MIPARLHFCWIGPTLPWAYAFAVLSAAARGGLDEVVLHHTDALTDEAPVRALRAATGVRLAPVEPASLLHVAGEGLAALYARLENPVQRSDVLRAAILFCHGGIYADLDTMTVASLRPLLGAKAFVGAERIVWPPGARKVRSVPLDLGRKLLRALPGGWRPFRRVERFYHLSVNNAVMGSAPGSALTAAYLRAMVELPPLRQTAPYGLGPHLLRQVVAALPPPHVTVHDPDAFYPLAPEISEHWFRRVRRADPGEVLRPATRIVHWYASVRTRARVAAIDPAHVARHHETELYSALVWRCVPGLAALA